MINFEIILLIIILLFLIYLIFFKKFQEPYKTFHYNDIFIYIIHKSDMEYRRERFLNYLKIYFPKNPYKIIEPISIENIKSNLHKYKDENILTQKAYEDILSNKIADEGSNTLKSLSLYLTNISIWKEELNKNRLFMILEDDFILKENFVSKMKHILNHLPIDWKLIYLSCHIKKHEYNASFIKNHLLKINTRTHGQGAVLYNPNILSILLMNLYPIHLQIDHDIPDKLIMTNKINTYMAVNKHLDTIIHNDNFYYGSTTQENE